MTQEPSLNFGERPSAYTEYLSHYTHTHRHTKWCFSYSLNRIQSNSLAFFLIFIFKLPFWLLRLVKPCSVKRFFDSTEHSEVELVSSTKEERDTERKGRRPWKDQGKKSFAALTGNLHGRMRKGNWKSRYNRRTWAASCSQCAGACTATGSENNLHDGNQNWRKK